MVLVLSNMDLRLIGFAACILTCVVQTLLPLIEYYLLYKTDTRLLVLPLVTWVASIVVALIGLAGFFYPAGLLLGIHAALGIAVAAVLGAYNTSAYFLLHDRCERIQSSYSGCGLCGCAANSTCTTSLLSSDLGCGGCKAWGTDLCDSVTTKASLLPYIGLVSLLVVAFPSVLSLLSLARVESEQGNLANKLQYARNMLSLELKKLEEGSDGAPVMGEQVRCEMLRTMLAFGRDNDHALALRVCERLHINVDQLMAPGPLAGIKPGQVVPYDDGDPSRPGTQGGRQEAWAEWGAGRPPTEGGAAAEEGALLDPTTKAEALSVTDGHTHGPGSHGVDDLMPLAAPVAEGAQELRGEEGAAAKPKRKKKVLKKTMNGSVAGSVTPPEDVETGLLSEAPSIGGDHQQHAAEDGLSASIPIKHKILKKKKPGEGHQ